MLYHRIHRLHIGPMAEQVLTSLQDLLLLLPVSQWGLYLEYLLTLSNCCAAIFAQYSLLVACMDRILLSKHPSPCKCPPPILHGDPMVHVYTHCTYKWLLCVSTHPRFWPVNFKRPWVLTQENMVCSCDLLHGKSISLSEYISCDFTPN